MFAFPEKSVISLTRSKVKKMEYIATEFPDVCQWFETVPSEQTLMSRSVSEPNSPTEEDMPEITHAPTPNNSPSKHEEETSILQPHFEVEEEWNQSWVDEDLNEYKARVGCSWSESEHTCNAGENCLFVRNILGLDQIPHSIAFTPKPRIQRVMLARPTANGLFQISETRELTKDQIQMIMKMPRQNQIKIIQVSFK